MNMTPLNMSRDINGYNTFGIEQSNTKYATTLLAGVEQHLTVPATGDAAYRHVLAVFFQDAGSNIFVSVNATASLPGSSFALSDCEENPSARQVKPGDILSFITADTKDSVGVSFYAIT